MLVLKLRIVILVCKSENKLQIIKCNIPHFNANTKKA